VRFYLKITHLKKGAGVEFKPSTTGKIKSNNSIEGLVANEKINTQFLIPTK
jgi:hypothetical protein